MIRFATIIGAWLAAGLVILVLIKDWLNVPHGDTGATLIALGLLFYIFLPVALLHLFDRR